MNSVKATYVNSHEAIGPVAASARHLLTGAVGAGSPLRASLQLVRRTET